MLVDWTDEPSRHRRLIAVQVTAAQTYTHTLPYTARYTLRSPMQTDRLPHSIVIMLS